MNKETATLESKLDAVPAANPAERFRATADFEPHKKLFKALASDERIEILRLLKKNGEMFAQDIENHFYMEQSTASHHLNTLLRAGAVSNRKSGRYIYYSLKPESITMLLERFLKLI